MGLKQFLWDLMFKGVDNYDLTKKVKEDEAKIYDLILQIKINSDEYKAKLIDFQKQIQDGINIVNTISLNYDKAINPDKFVVVPEFLNTSQRAYYPITKITTTSGVKSILVSPEAIYSKNSAIKKLVEDMKLKELYNKDKKECAKAIWGLVLDNLDYQYDDGEDWRFSAISLSYRDGDCEDGTILFLDLAHEAGFMADEIFNATGWVTAKDGQKFGHSFPILNYGDGWYIYETTLTFLPKNPMKFLGSNYDCSWGLANWVWDGHLRDDKLQI